MVAFLRFRPTAFVPRPADDSNASRRFAQPCHIDVSRRMAGNLILPALVPASLPGMAEARKIGTLSNNSKRVMEFLAAVPVFAVTNSTGSPFNEPDRDAPGGQAGHYYFSEADALEALGRAGGKVGTDPLEVKRFQLSAVYLPFMSEGKKELPDQIRLVPFQVEVENAVAVLKDAGPFAPKYPSGWVPLFSYPGLKLNTLSGESIIPAYLQENDLGAVVKKAGVKGDQSKVGVQSLQDVVRTLLEADPNKVSYLRVIPASTTQWAR